MYLKSIEIQGFKSFAGKTVLKFHDGITGIVGPNGSGKSNVADAVRWVLGEQRIKQLRGGSMQDVIFAGTVSRKPLGFASVAITLDNSDHSLPVSFEEVTVTRRLYRSGESEYRINGTACRLKDIYEMFYDTGIGKEGYSIIGQGQIEAILNGKPEERRELFDEAAGIVKFKRRKLEAQKKLESEQQNLIRINDIVSELERQVGPLQRASEKAKIYLKWRDEMKMYDVNLFLTEYNEIREKLDRLREDAGNAAQQLAKVRREAEEIREKYDLVSEELEQSRLSQQALQERITGDRLSGSQWEGQVRLLEEQIRMADEGGERSRERLEEIDDLLLAKTRDIDAISETGRELQDRIDEGEAEQAAAKARLEEASRRAAEAESALEALAKKRTELLEKQSTLSSQISGARVMIEQLKGRKAQLEEQARKLQFETDGRRQVLEDTAAGLAKIDEEIASLEAESTATGETLGTCQESLNGMNARLESTQLAYHRESSRLESLRNIAERYDGYGNSIRKVMEQRSREPGILGVVADLIRTEAEYETAIETALGGAIQNIVTEDEDTAKRMIRFLKDGKHGRATFLPLTAMRPWEFGQRAALREPGVIGLASALVDCEPRFEAMASQLLGRTIVTDNVDNAIALARKYRYSLRIVTLGGESLAPGGAMTGGAFKNAGNLLGRRREIEKLGEVVRQKKEELDRLLSDIERTRTERNRLRDYLRELGSRLQEKYLAQNTLRMRRQELEGEQSRTGNVWEQIRSEAAELGGSIEEKTKELSAAQEALEACGTQREALLLEEEALTASRDQAREEEGAISGTLSDGMVDLTAYRQKLTYLQAEAERLKEEKRTLEGEKSRINASLEKARADLDEKRQECERLRSQIEEAEQRAQSAGEELQKMQKEQEEKTRLQRDLFDRRESLTEDIALLEKETYRLQSQAEKLEEKREERIAYMWDTYELTYSSALPLKRDDLGSRSEWRKKMNELKTRIRELGSVNVGAIEEYKEVSERYTFMTGQQADLIEAEKALEKIIAELDAGMRRQFREKFEEIRKAFDVTFKELFGGGTGQLELMEEEDILTSGIRIIAQPPGKKLQNMMQMSGGEKALTAIALLFAIQSLKPSPFCLLDEIEAALDENNVSRYAAYLHKLTKNTQFIIITHRRGTMAAADRLYGITMQEKGVSALVSVNLVESELDA